MGLSYLMNLPPTITIEGKVFSVSDTSVIVGDGTVRTSISLHLCEPNDYRDYRNLTGEQLDKKLAQFGLKRKIETDEEFKERFKKTEAEFRERRF